METTAKIAEISPVYFRRLGVSAAMAILPLTNISSPSFSGEQVSLSSWASFEGDSMAPVSLTGRGQDFNPVMFMGYALGLTCDT